MSRRSDRTYGAIRTVLITFGVAAFTFLLSRHEAETPSALGGWGSATTYVLAGLVLQVLLFAAHAFLKRQAPDAESAEQGRLLVELIGDGVTVLLFALGTLGAVMQAPYDL